MLSQADSRYWQAVTGSSSWMFDFKVFRKGDDQPLGNMVFSHKWQRSGTLRIPYLEEGEYVVHVSGCRFMLGVRWVKPVYR